MPRPSRSDVMQLLVRHRVIVVALVCAVAVAATAISIVGGSHPTPTAAAADQHLMPLDAVTGKPFYLFRSTILDHDYGRLAVAPVTDPNHARALTNLACARVAFVGNRGVCVSDSGGLFGDTKATVFNAQFAVLSTVVLQGFPNRVQESPDGHYAAATDFVSGDSYATAGFSTRTVMIDLRRGRVLFDLEKMTVTRNGRPFANVNFNYWGVTFAHDGQHFYATLGSGSATYLIEGDIATMQAQVLRSGVECPSLSPDGTRIAFKKRLPGPTVRWRLSVLDLSTLVDHPLAETRDVDDQAYWLNNTTVAYGLAKGGAESSVGVSTLTAGGSVRTDMWSVPADGGGSPHLLVQGAWSVVLVP